MKSSCQGWQVGCVRSALPTCLEAARQRSGGSQEPAVADPVGVVTVAASAEPHLLTGIGYSISSFIIWRSNSIALVKELLLWLSYLILHSNEIWMSTAKLFAGSHT